MEVQELARETKKVEIDHSGVMEVRLAVPEDAPALFDIIHTLWLEEHHNHHPFDEEEVVARIHAATHRASSFMGVIGPVGGPLRAIIYLVLDKIWFSKEPQLTGFTTFVRPEWRESSYARQLLAFAKNASDTLGVKLLSAVISDEKTEAKCVLWRRKFPKIGEMFLYDPNKKG